MLLTTNRYFIISLKALAVVFCSLICAEFCVRFYAYLEHPLISGNRHFEEKYLVTRHLQHHYPTLLLLGGASMNKGVYPDLLSQTLSEQGLNVQVANLAFDDATSESEGKLLQAVISNSIPVNLIIDSPFAANAPASNAFRLAVNTNKEIEKSYFNRCICNEHSRQRKGLRCWIEEHLFLFRYWSSVSHRVTEFANIVFSSKMSTAARSQPSDHSLNVSYNGWNPDFKVMTETEALDYLSKTTDKKTAPTVIDPFIQVMCANNHLQRASILLPLYKANSGQWKINNSQIKIGDFNDDFIYFSTPDSVNCYGGVEMTLKLAAILAKEPYRHLLEEAQ